MYGPTPLGLGRTLFGPTNAGRRPTVRPMNRTDYWLGKFSKSRVDRARGDPAPHKPLLLLVLCDLAESGDLREVLPLSPELAFRFCTYWSIVAARRSQRPDVRLPFHFLSGDGIWSVVDERGEPSPDKKLTKHARLPSDLVAFLEDPANREKARHLLIAKYFRPSEQMALYEMIGVPVPSRQEIEQNAAYKSPEEARLAGREARFRVRVVSAYNFTCALTTTHEECKNHQTNLRPKLWIQPGKSPSHWQSWRLAGVRRGMGVYR